MKKREQRPRKENAITETPRRHLLMLSSCQESGEHINSIKFWGSHVTAIWHTSSAPQAAKRAAKRRWFHFCFSPPFSAHFRSGRCSSLRQKSRYMEETGCFPIKPWGEFCCFSWYRMGLQSGCSLGRFKTDRKEFQDGVTLRFCLGAGARVLTALIKNRSCIDEVRQPLA